MLSSCVAHVFSKWLWNSPSRPYYYWYHLCFYIPHELYFSLYCRIFSASFLTTFLSPEIATSINIHVPFSLSRIIMTGLLLLIVVSLFIIIIITSKELLKERFCLYGICKTNTEKLSFIVPSNTTKFYSSTNKIFGLKMPSSGQHYKTFLK